MGPRLVVLVMVLEGNAHFGAVGQNLAVFQVHVKLGDFGHPQVAAVI